jgi:hypothetical protein
MICSVTTHNKVKNTVKAHRILKQLLTDVTPSMHKTRPACLNTLVMSLLSVALFSAIGLGRYIASKITEKHQIKRRIRLCSKPHLQHEMGSSYSSVARRLIAEQLNPIILVDWSDVEPRKHYFLLGASGAVEGRFLTVYEQIYPITKKEKLIW